MAARVAPGAKGPFCWLPNGVRAEARFIQHRAMLFNSPRKWDQAYFTSHPIHTKLNAPADCNCRYISSYFYPEGRCDR